MDTPTFITHFLGENFDAAQFLALYLWGVIGLITRFFMSYKSSEKVPVGNYLKTQTPRIIKSILGLFLLLFFGEFIGTPITNTMGALLAAFTADAVVDDFQKYAHNRKAKITE